MIIAIEEVTQNGSLSDECVRDGQIEWKSRRVARPSHRGSIVNILLPTMDDSTSESQLITTSKARVSTGGIPNWYSILNER